MSRGKMCLRECVDIEKEIVVADTREAVIEINCTQHGRNSVSYAIRL